MSSSVLTIEPYLGHGKRRVIPASPGGKGGQMSIVLLLLLHLKLHLRLSEVFFDGSAERTRFAVWLEACSWNPVTHTVCRLNFFPFYLRSWSFSRRFTVLAGNAATQRRRTSHASKNYPLSGSWAHGVILCPDLHMHL